MRSFIRPRGVGNHAHHARNTAVFTACVYIATVSLLQTSQFLYKLWRPDQNGPVGQISIHRVDEERRVRPVLVEEVLLFDGHSKFSVPGRDVETLGRIANGLHGPACGVADVSLDVDEGEVVIGPKCGENDANVAGVDAPVPLADLFYVMANGTFTNEDGGRVSVFIATPAK
jgi:hypothetical protein